MATVCQNNAIHDIMELFGALSNPEQYSSYEDQWDHSLRTTHKVAGEGRARGILATCRNVMVSLYTGPQIKAVSSSIKNNLVVSWQLQVI